MSEDRQEDLQGGGEAILVLITTASDEEADKIGKTLVEKRLAACVHIVPQFRSIFFWKDKICDELEVLLLVKSRRGRFTELAREVKALHSYTVPEIIALPILEGAVDYLEWIGQVTT
jgi:periplasmic divalent cation tolerance protein